MNVNILIIRNLKIIINLLLINLLFIGCVKKEIPPAMVSIAGSQAEDSTAVGIKTEALQKEKYNQLIYVNINSDTSEDGKKESPFKSIHAALDAVNSMAMTGKVAILIAKGEYSENTIKMQPNVDFYGGFNAPSWERNIDTNKTILYALEGQRIIEGADNSRLDGFILDKAKVRGKGGAILCAGVSPVLSNNIFKSNTTLAPQNWAPKYWHETANNGGAIFCENGSQAIIRNCMFLNNTTENGRGAGIAADNKCKLRISNNVFINNVSGKNDPMRSSDGGAISIFNWCQATIDHNVFLSNRALNKNDGGGVFVALWSSAVIDRNIFVDNIAGDDAGGLFVGGQEHRYGGAPLDPIPATEDFSVHITNNLFFGNKNSSLNSGVMRFTMESKGSYTNNISALNNGIYFQRSEVSVRKNIILDNFLFIETKNGLLPGEIRDNLIWGDFTLDVNPLLSGNIIKGKVDSIRQQYKEPKFVKDGSTFSVISLNVNKDNLETTLLTDGENVPENNLAHRIIRSGDKWGVIKSNSGSEITVWGNLYGAETVQILPTYTLSK
ncbi:MAG: right-handed parallel beta-helix repeat-containing protein [Flavobacteriaceae bacterium]|nr:right-handed parallel beta-helix repeat-containing protein [Flavobacteriaceae bacterium]